MYGLSLQRISENRERTKKADKITKEYHALFILRNLLNRSPVSFENSSMIIPSVKFYPRIDGDVEYVRKQSTKV